MKAISTITTSQPLQLTDHSMDIVTSLMLLL